MVGEVLQAQLESDSVAVRALEYDAAKLIFKPGTAVRGQAHHFILVAELPETEVLADGRVIEPQRMRESDGAVHLEVIALTCGPHGTGKVSQSISGKHRSLVKGRDEKSAGQMCYVVFDTMVLRADNRGVHTTGASQFFVDPAEPLQRPCAFDGKAGHPHRVIQFRS